MENINRTNKKEIKANAMRLKSRGRFKKMVARLPVSGACIGLGVAALSLISTAVLGIINAVDLQQFTKTPEFIKEKNLREQELIEKFDKKEISADEFADKVGELDTVKYQVELYKKYHPEEGAKYETKDKAIDGLWISAASGAGLFGLSAAIGLPLDARIEELDIEGDSDISLANKTLRELSPKKYKKKKDLSEIVEEQYYDIED